ncbi:DUF6354 family protein [Streptomyces albireticuli]|nr:DUF6354 family protein [Streptomyces albireticuli]
MSEEIRQPGAPGTAATGGPVGPGQLYLDLASGRDDRRVRVIMVEENGVLAACRVERDLSGLADVFGRTPRIHVRALADPRRFALLEDPR